MSQLDDKLAELKRWFAENPKLPQEIDSLLLKRFLKCMYNDLDDTKKLIEHNYALRNKHTHIFINRDPEDEKVRKSAEATDLVPLPGLTPERYKLLCYRLVDLDPRLMNSVEECKIFFMVADCRFTIVDVEQIDDEEDSHADKMADGDVQIVDIAGFTMAHIARISFLTFRIYLKFLQEAYPVRLRAMHVINCPSYLNRMVAIVKPFISDDVFKLIHFHTSGLDSLYEHVPREMLPEEYGGQAGKMADLKLQWTQLLKEKRDYIMDSKQWKVEPAENRSRWHWF